MNRSQKIIGYFFIYVLICLMSTFFCAWFPSISSTQWLLIAAVVLSVFINGKFYGTKPFIFLLLYFVVLYFNWRSGDKHFHEISICFFEFMVPLFAMNFCIIANKESESFNKVIIVVFTVIITIAAIGSIIAGQVLPEIVRNMQSETSGDIDALRAYYRLGVSNYSLPHALPAVVPLLVYALKANKRFSIVWLFYLLSLIFCLLLIFYSGASGAILIAMFALAISLLTSLNGISKQRIFWICIVFVPFIVSNSLADGIVRFLIDIFGNNAAFESFTEHLVDISESLTSESGGTGDVGARVDKYQETFNAVFDNIVLGTNMESGGHMALIDRLAYLGLVGFIPLILTYYYYLKSVSVQVNFRVKPFFVESVICAFMMMILKNMIHNEMNVVLFAMIPIMALYFSRSSENSYPI